MFEGEIKSKEEEPKEEPKEKSEKEGEELKKQQIEEEGKPKKEKKTLKVTLGTTKGGDILKKILEGRQENNIEKIKKSKEVKEKREDREDNELSLSNKTAREGILTKEGRPTITLRIDDKDTKEKIFTVIEFPMGSEILVGEKIKEKKEIPVSSLETRIGPKGKYYHAKFDVFRKEKEEGKITKGRITREEIDRKKEKYLNFIEKSKKEGRISEKFTEEKAIKEILSFIVSSIIPGGNLEKWKKEIKETLQIKKPIEIKNNIIKDLILGEKKFEDIKKEDLKIGFESRKEKYEYILKHYARKMEKIIAMYSNKSPEEVSKLSEEGLKELISKIEMRFATHGKIIIDKETGEIKFLRIPDLDGKTCLYLFKLAGFGITKKKIGIVEPGRVISGYVNFDNSTITGISLNKESKTTEIDHHGEFSKKTNIPTARLVYLLLLSKGFLKKDSEKNTAIRKLLTFVSWVDREEYPLPPTLSETTLPKNTSAEDIKKHKEEYKKNPRMWAFKNSDANISGLNRFINFNPINPDEPHGPIRFDKLLEHFQKGKSPIDILSNKELEEYGLTKASEEQRKVINESEKIIKELKEKGYYITTQGGGKILVNDGKHFPGGYQAARAYGFAGYINYNKDAQSFFISIDGANLSNVKQSLEKKYNQKRLICLQENILMLPLTVNPELREKKPLRISLEQIIQELGGEIPEGELKKLFSPKNHKK